jgi:hypothetical protein
MFFHKSQQALALKNHPLNGTKHLTLPSNKQFSIKHPKKQED